MKATPPGRKIKPPKPISSIRSLAAIPGLSPNESQSLARKILPYVRKRLTPNLSWKKQDPEQLERAIADVRRRWPWLDAKYEDAWPLQVYLPHRIRYYGRLTKPALKGRKKNVHAEEDALDQDEMDIDETMVHGEDASVDQGHTCGRDPVSVSATVDPISNGSTSAGPLALVAGSSQIQINSVERIFFTASGTAIIDGEGADQAKKVWKMKLSNSTCEEFDCVGLKPALLRLNDLLESKLAEDNARELEMSLYMRWRA